MEKITKREMYEALYSMANGGHLAFETDNGDVVPVSYEMLSVFAENEIAILDKKAAKAKETAARKKAENDSLLDTVRQVMSTKEFETIADIASRIEDDDVSVAKVQNRLSVLVRNGEAEKQQITIPANETGKARKAMAYRKLV